MKIIYLLINLKSKANKLKQKEHPEEKTNRIPKRNTRANNNFSGPSEIL